MVGKLWFQQPRTVEMPEGRVEIVLNGGEVVLAPVAIIQRSPALNMLLRHAPAEQGKEKVFKLALQVDRGDFEMIIHFLKNEPLNLSDRKLPELLKLFSCGHQFQCYGLLCDILQELTRFFAATQGDISPECILHTYSVLRRLPEFPDVPDHMPRRARAPQPSPAHASSAPPCRPSAPPQPSQAHAPSAPPCRPSAPPCRPSAPPQPSPAHAPSAPPCRPSAPPCRPSAPPCRPSAPPCRPRAPQPSPAHAPRTQAHASQAHAPSAPPHEMCHDDPEQATFCDKLKDTCLCCLQVIDQAMPKLVKSDALLSLSPDVLVELAQRSTLQAKELDIARAAVRYVHFHWPISGVHWSVCGVGFGIVGVGGGVGDEEVKQWRARVLKSVRFLTMSPNKLEKLIRESKNVLQREEQEVLEAVLKHHGSGTLPGHLEQYREYWQQPRTAEATAGQQQQQQRQKQCQQRSKRLDTGLMVVARVVDAIFG